MKNWQIFLQYVPWCSPFVIHSKKIDVEYANSDNGVAPKASSHIKGKWLVVYFPFNSFRRWRVRCGQKFV